MALTALIVSILFGLATIAIAVRQELFGRRTATLEAADRHVQIALQRAALLDTDLQPRLLPADEERPRVLPREDVGVGRRGEVWVVPVEFRLLNAGNGIARIRSVEGSVSTGAFTTPPGAKVERHVATPVIAPGAEGTIRLDFLEPQSDYHSGSIFNSGDYFTLIVRYLGVGENEGVLQFHWKILPGSRWDVEVAMDRPPVPPPRELTT